MKAYATPAVLALLAWTGLVLCLLGDGWSDAVGVALLLAIPATALVRSRTATSVRRSSASRSSNP